MRVTVRGALVHILDERFRPEGHVVRFCLCLAAMPNMRLSESERAAIAAGVEAARDVGDAITTPPPPAHSAHCTPPRQLPRCPGCAWLRMLERELLQQQTAWRQYVRSAGSEELAAGLPGTDSMRAFYEAQGLGEDPTAMRGVSAAFSEEEERRSERSVTRTPESVLVSEADDDEGYAPQR
jgi:hypothetical protein